MHDREKHRIFICVCVLYVLNMIIMTAFKHFDFDIASFWLDSNLLFITIYRCHWTRFLSFFLCDFRNMFYFFRLSSDRNIIISKSHQSRSNEWTWTSVLKWNSPIFGIYIRTLVSENAGNYSEHFQLDREHTNNTNKTCWKYVSIHFIKQQIRFVGVPIQGDLWSTY